MDELPEWEARIKLQLSVGRQLLLISSILVLTLFKYELYLYISLFRLILGILMLASISLFFNEILLLIKSLLYINI